MGVWLPPVFVDLISAFLTLPSLEIKPPLYCSLGYSHKICWRSTGDPSWTICLTLVEFETQKQVAVLAKGLSNRNFQYFDSVRNEPGDFQVRIEAYNEKNQLQDWCYSDVFCVEADGERELDENAVKLMKMLYPSRQEVHVVGGRLCGAFNSIVVLRGVMTSQEDVMLRTRRFEPLSDIGFENITTTNTLVQELQPLLPFAVPKLLRHDGTVNNPLGRQYWLQTRVPGVALSEVIDSLTISQRVMLAREMAKVMTAIHKVKKFPHCGDFVRHPKSGAAVVGCPLFYSAKIEEEGLCFAGYFQYAHFVPEYSPPSNLYAFLKQRFDAVVESSRKPHFKYIWRVAELKLRQFGRRCYRKNRLAHTDLYPRNILVTVKDDQIRITGVVDWDQSEVLPPELACLTNPGWLWTDEKEPLNGYDLTSPIVTDVGEGEREEADAIRSAFVGEMERLQQGYVACVQRSQQCDLGVFAGLARYGFDERGDKLPAALLDAGLKLVAQQGWLTDFRAELLSQKEKKKKNNNKQNPSGITTG